MNRVLVDPAPPIYGALVLPLAQSRNRFILANWDWGTTYATVSQADAIWSWELGVRRNLRSISTNWPVLVVRHEGLSMKHFAPAVPDAAAYCPVTGIGDTLLPPTCLPATDA